MITTSGCGPSISVLLILEPVTLTLVSSTVSESDALELTGAEAEEVASCTVSSC